MINWAKLISEWGAMFTAYRMWGVLGLIFTSCLLIHSNINSEK